MRAALLLFPLLAATLGCSVVYRLLVLGTIIDAVTGLPVQGVTVRVVETTNPQRDFALGKTDKRGMLTIKMAVDGGAPGLPWEARIEKPGYQSQVIPLGYYSSEELAGKVTKIHVAASIVPLAALPETVQLD